MAAAVSYGYFHSIGESIEVSGASYRKEYPELPDISFSLETIRVVIVDFSYPPSWLNHWIQQGLRVKVIEHHKDKFPWLENFSGAILDAKECGSSLAWKHFFPDRQLPEILMHVRNRDIGLNGYYSGDIPESEAVNAGLGQFRSQIKALPMNERLLKLFEVCEQENPLTAFAESGKPGIEQRDRLIASRILKASLNEIDGIACAYYDFTNDPEIAPHYSMLGHRLAKAHGVTIAWLVDGKANHLRSLSPETDCAIIAKARGGGGHPCAAGWQS
jgi:oligoribonuclease NrnB/cAMP/cGMP phosphodiesterase (DHH superfamily)